ncbi:hypothetical protein EUGRSUZ_D02547 [Eucalyptus grandis]|uniref:Uncharacterized protein n=2 Tax=Eucalyptus grandis TaxID=71139 RepID=A0ACC3LAA5_EUCGR|nr:hypothetical protein EUGRSUZ_D02547 [Eucalyptus grandis]
MRQTTECRKMDRLNLQRVHSIAQHMGRCNTSNVQVIASPSYLMLTRCHAFHLLVQPHLAHMNMEMCL